MSQNIIIQTFDYYLQESENGWYKIPRRVAFDMRESYLMLQRKLEKLEKDLLSETRRADGFYQQTIDQSKRLS